MSVGAARLRCCTAVTATGSLAQTQIAHTRLEIVADFSMMQKCRWNGHFLVVVFSAIDSLVQTRACVTRVHDGPRVAPAKMDSRGGKIFTRTRVRAGATAKFAPNARISDGVIRVRGRSSDARWMFGARCRDAIRIADSRDTFETRARCEGGGDGGHVASQSSSRSVRAASPRPVRGVATPCGLARTNITGRASSSIVRSPPADWLSHPRLSSPARRTSRRAAAFPSPARPCRDCWQ